MVRLKLVPYGADGAGPWRRHRYRWDDLRLANAWHAYDAALTAAKVTHEGYVYEGAQHGFNNDATAQRYNEAASKLAMQRTVAWFKKYLA